MDQVSQEKLARILRQQRVSSLGTLREGGPLVSMVLFSPAADFSAFLSLYEVIDPIFLFFPIHLQDFFINCSTSAALHLEKCSYTQNSTCFSESSYSHVTTIYRS